MCRERKGAEDILPRVLSRMKEEKAEEGAHGQTRLQGWAEEEDSGQRLRKVKEVWKNRGRQVSEKTKWKFLGRMEVQAELTQCIAPGGAQSDPSLCLWCPEVIQHGSPGSTESRTEKRQR